MANLLAPGEGPSRETLETWRAAARSGAGAPWLSPTMADALARYGLMCGEGVYIMEACAPRFREPVRDVAWEILGADPDGENWVDHRDPQTAYTLFRKKLALARRDRVRLDYKIWLRPAGG